MIPFPEIQDRAKSVALALCKRWLPTGSVGGNWYLCSTPWRTDKNPSLGVSLTTGRWKDFATGERGDLIDLYQKIHGGTSAEAARAVARVVGHPLGETECQR